jgi:hypothetical protein
LTLLGGNSFKPAIVISVGALAAPLER